MLRLFFGISLALIFYGYFIYPLTVFLLAKLIPSPVKKGDYRPKVTIFIPAYNEEGMIRRKIENCLALDYPGDKLEVIIASDGSTDSTASIAREYAPRGVRLFESPGRKGKTAILNEYARESKGDIIVFSDASGLLNTEAVLRLAENFNDESVGCVCGLYRLLPKNDNLAARGYLAYLGYDIKMKKAESAFASILGAHGALYAIRKSLFKPLPGYAINDDFYIPINILLSGYRAIYEDKAIATDYIEYCLGDEFRRRIRISFGNWQQIRDFSGSLTLKRPLLAWQFFSHKILRSLLPFFIVFVAAVSFLYGYGLISISLLILIIAALSALLLRNSKFAVRFLHAPFFFVAGNIAYIIGTVKFFLGYKTISW